MTDQPLVPVSPGAVESPAVLAGSPAVAPVEIAVDPLLEQVVEPTTESTTEPEVVIPMVPELPEPVVSTAPLEDGAPTAQVENDADEDPVAIARAAQTREGLAEDAAEAARAQLQGLPGAADRNTQTGAPMVAEVQSSPAAAAVEPLNDTIELKISQTAPGKTTDPSQVIETP